MAEDPPPRGLPEVRLDFLRVELAMGLTFARIAARAGADSQKRETNRAHAQKAYDVVYGYFTGQAWTSAQSAELSHSLSRLKTAIDAIPQ